MARHPESEEQLNIVYNECADMSAREIMKKYKGRDQYFLDSLEGLCKARFEFGLDTREKFEAADKAGTERAITELKKLGLIEP